MGKRVLAEPEWTTCVRCGKRFVLALHHDGRRFTEGATKRIYCGDTCKVMAYRERKREEERGE